MNELIAALRRDRMDEFKSRFRRIDVLIVDDVQFLAGRERTQEEFFHTFNSLYDSHRQIVLTSDKFPKEIPELEERLRNRFEWGLIADIQPPDIETRVAIVEKKAEIEGIELPHEVALFLATNIDSNVRELEGSLTRLGAFASLNKCPITVDFAREVLQSVLRDRGDSSDHDRVDPEGRLRLLPHPPDRSALEEAHPHRCRCRGRSRCTCAGATRTPRFRSSATASAGAITRPSSTPPRSSSAGCATTRPSAPPSSVSSGSWNDPADRAMSGGGRRTAGADGAELWTTCGDAVERM